MKEKPKEKLPAAKKPKPTRSPEDPCLLCKVRPATKARSHIITQFWADNMKGEDTFYKVNTYKDHLAETSQDSPKEDFILCPQCEERFSFVERYMANHFYKRFRDSAYDSEFQIQKNWNRVTQELDWLIPVNVNPGIFKLLVYSFIWRMSISGLEDFGNFKLDPETEEKLRWVLDAFMQYKERDNPTFYEAHKEEFINFPFTIVTTYQPLETTGNMIAAFNMKDDQIALFVNEFIILFTKRWHPKAFFGGAWNPGSKPISISLCDEKHWNKVYGGLVHFLASKRFENKQSGRIK